MLQSRDLVSFPITEEGRRKVEATVANINNSYFGVETYEDAPEKSVAFLYFLIKNHPFTDGNKRTASLIFEVICDVNKLIPNFKNFTLDQLAVFIESIKEDDHQGVIKSISTILFKN